MVADEKPCSLRFFKDLVGALCASTGPAASTGGDARCQIGLAKFDLKIALPSEASRGPRLRPNTRVLWPVFTHRFS